VPLGRIKNDGIDLSDALMVYFSDIIQKYKNSGCIYERAKFSKDQMAFINFKKSVRPSDNHLIVISSSIYALLDHPELEKYSFLYT
jgi:hypothetical protein